VPEEPFLDRENSQDGNFVGWSDLSWGIRTDFILRRGMKKGVPQAHLVTDLLVFGFMLQPYRLPSIYCFCEGPFLMPNRLSIDLMSQYCRQLHLLLAQKWQREAEQQRLNLHGSIDA
jgi:hypothetical protein